MEATHGARGPALRGAPASSERASFPAARRQPCTCPGPSAAQSRLPCPGAAGPRTLRGQVQAASPIDLEGPQVDADSAHAADLSLQSASRSEALGDPAVDSRWLGVRQGPEGFLPPLAAPPPLAGPLCTPGPVPPPPVRSSLLFNVSIPRRTLHLPSSRLRMLCPLGVRLSLQQALGPRRGSQSFSTTRLLGSLRKPSPPS